MKFYNFLLLTKWKVKKKPMRDKVRIENAEMRLIKWESLKWWERERERERVTNDIHCDYELSRQEELNS